MQAADEAGCDPAMYRLAASLSAHGPCQQHIQQRIITHPHRFHRISFLPALQPLPCTGHRLLAKKRIDRCIARALLRQTRSDLYEQVLEGPLQHSAIDGRIGARLATVILDQLPEHLPVCPLMRAQKADRKAQSGRELITVDTDARTMRPVIKAADDHHRQLQLPQLHAQPQTALQPLRIADVQDEVDLILLQKTRRDPPFIPCFLQRIGSRQIDEMITAAMAIDARLFLFHRDARPVAHLEIRMCQQIDPGALAYIGISGQCDRIMFHMRVTSIFSASLRRRDSKAPSLSNSSGS